MYISWSTQWQNAHKSMRKFSLAHHGTLMESRSIFHLLKVYEYK